MPRSTAFHADITGRAWVLDAECAKPEYDPDLWFPDDRYTVAREKQALRAIAVCRKCPVLEQCLIYACRYRLYGTADFHGIWAGRHTEWFMDRRKVEMTLKLLEARNVRR